MGLPHGGKADVYSWALLAWSVVAVREPFEGIGRSVFYDRVVVSWRAGFGGRGGTPWFGLLVGLCSVVVFGLLVDWFVCRGRPRAARGVRPQGLLHTIGLW